MHTICTRAHAHDYMLHFSTRADTLSTCTKENTPGPNWAWFGPVQALWLENTTEPIARSRRLRMHLASPRSPSEETYAGRHSQTGEDSTTKTHRLCEQTYAYTHTHPHTQTHKNTHTHTLTHTHTHFFTAYQHGQGPSLGKWHTICTNAHAHDDLLHFSTRADTSNLWFKWLGLLDFSS